MQELAVSRLVHPFWGRATLIESPVDETELGSGIVLPHKHPDDHGVKRGVVVEIDASWDESQPQTRQAADQIAVGTVVYYRNGTPIRDVVVVEMTDILAYETAE